MLCQVSSVEIINNKISDSDWDYIFQNILWQKWKIVEGPIPDLRLDDPRRNYDAIPQGKFFL